MRFFVLSLLAANIVAAAPFAANQVAQVAPAKRAQLGTFCDKFRASCRSTCLAGKTGAQKIKFGCEKDATTKSYQFLCECNDKVKTRTALNGVTGPKPVYTTVSTSTYTTTSTVEVDETSTTLQGGSTRTSLETKTRTYTLSDKTVTSTDLSTTTTTKPVAGTQTITSRTTTTSTRSYSRGIVTFPTVATSTQTLTKVSVVASQGQRVAGKSVLRVATPQDGSGSVDSTTFCKGYSTSCSRTCSRLGSTASETTCKRTDTDTVTRYYTLYCECANGKVETSHALADIDGAIAGGTTISVTAVSTSVSYTSFTDVETIPVATYTTTLRSTKSVVGFEPPSTTVSRTISKTITQTSLHPTDATVTTKTTSTHPRVTSTIVTTTFTSPQTATITATTMIAIAPTGRIRVNDANNYDDPLTDTDGVRGYFHSTYDGTRVGVLNSTDDALDLVLVQDPNGASSGPYDTYYGVVDVATGNALVPAINGPDFVANKTTGHLLIPGTIAEAQADGYDLIYWALRDSDAGSTSDGRVQIQVSGSYHDPSGTNYILNANSWEPKIGSTREPFINIGLGDFGDDRHAQFISYNVGFSFEFADKP